jgi:hypothetical protein
MNIPMKYYQLYLFILLVLPGCGKTSETMSPASDYTGSGAETAFDKSFRSEVAAEAPQEFVQERN